MKIKLTSVFVNDQNKALDFYTKTLGFVKKTDISAGNYRWLTVVSAEDPNGSQLVLEPNATPLQELTRNPSSNRAFPQPCSSSTIFRRSFKG